MEPTTIEETIRRISVKAKCNNLRCILSDDMTYDWRIQLERWPAIFFIYPDPTGFLIAGRYREGLSVEWSGRDGKVVTTIREVFDHIDMFVAKL